MIVRGEPGGDANWNERTVAGPRANSRLRKPTLLFCLERLAFDALKQLVERLTLVELGVGHQRAVVGGPTGEGPSVVEDRSEVNKIGVSSYNRVWGKRPRGPDGNSRR